MTCPIFFKEEQHRDTERKRQIIKPARADAIDAALVFLHLLESDPDRGA